jgi:hypothetical protein
MCLVGLKSSLQVLNLEGHLKNFTKVLLCLVSFTNFCSSFVMLRMLPSFFSSSGRSTGGNNCSTSINSLFCNIILDFPVCCAPIMFSALDFSPRLLGATTLSYNLRGGQNERSTLTNYFPLVVFVF